MKRLLLKRILPFVMAIIMLASFCFPAGAFTIDSSGKTEEDKPYYTIEFNEGVLRVKLNPQKVYDALSDGDLTRAEIEQFIPKNVLDTLEGGVSKDALLALASEYINAEEIEKLLALLPENLLSKYFLNPEFLEQLITLDEILALVDVDELLSGIQDQEKFNRELNALLTPVLGDLLTEKVKDNLLSDQEFMEGVLADAIDRLLAEHETEVMDVLPELVTDGVVDSILSNELYKNALIDAAGDKIKEKVMGDSALRQKLADYMMTFVPEPGEEVAEDNPLKQLLENEDLLALIEKHPEWLMTKETVAYIFDTRSDLLTNDALIDIFGEDALRDVIKQDGYAVLHELMKSETLIGDLINDPEFYTVASTVVTDEIVNKLVNSDDFDVFDYMTEGELAALLEGKTLVLTNAVKAGVTSKQISDFLKGYEDVTASSLIQKEYLNPEKINISALDLDVTTLYEDLEDADRQVILDAYGIDEAYVEDYILNTDSLSDDDRLAIVTNAWFSFDTLIDNGYQFLISDMAEDKGITLESMLEKDLVDTGALLKKYPDSITLDELLADRDALKVASILSDTEYGIEIADILAADLVDVDRVLSDSNIEISDLALSGSVLSAMAKDALEIDGVEQLLKDSFVAHIENGDIDPVEFLKHVDLAEVAHSENVDLSALIHALVDPREGDTPEQAAIKEKRIHDLQALVQLTAEDYRKIFGKMSYGDILDALSPHTAEMVEKMGIDPFLDCFGAITLIDVLFATPEKSGMMALIDDGVLSLDQVAVAIGGVEKPEANDADKKKAGLAVLANKVDTELVIEKLGDLLMQYVTFAQIVEYAGGYQTVLGWYSTEELNAIVRKVGPKELFNLIKDNGILQSSAAKDVAKTVVKEILKDKENLKSFVKGLKTPLTQIIVEEIASMKINDTTFFKNGLIDLEEAVRAVINAIPDVETFCGMKSGDVIVGMVLHTEFRDDAAMTVGVEVSFDGDFTELQKLAEQQKDLFRIEVDEDDLDIHVSSVLPEKVATLYGKVLESEKLPAELKGKLLSLFDKTLPEMVEVFADLSDEEIAKLSEAVNDKLDAVLEKADGAVEKLPGQVADRVDALLGKLRTADGLKQLIEKLEKAVDKLPEKAKSFSLFGMYEGSGEFVMNPVSFELNIEEKISDKLGLPAGMLKADLEGSFGANVTFEGLYSLTFLDREGDSTVFILPAGADLDVLKNVPGLDLTVFGENVPATMPAMDTIITPEREEHEYELIFILHYPDGTQKMLDRITYNKDAIELPEAPETPGAIRGYRVVWDDYDSMLGAADSQIVNVRYQLVIYELIFVKGDETVKVPFTVESIDNITLPETDDAGTGAYYAWAVGGKAWTLDEIKTYLKDSKNALDSLGSFEQVKDYHVYTISFYDLAGELFHTVEYTVLGLNDGEFMPTLPGAPAGQKNFWWNDTDQVRFDPDAFDFNTAKDLDVYVKADLLAYTYVFKFADPTKEDVVLEYTAETSWEDFSKLIPALSENAADGDYTYSWSIDVESDFPRLEEATVVQEIKTYKRYSITFETSAGTEIVYYYSTDDSASIIAKFPELSDSSAALGSGWYLDANGNGECDPGEEWDPNSFDVSLKKDLVVKERFSYIDYTYTFFYLDGRMIEITVNAATDKAWLISQIEAHTATATGYRNVWNDGVGTWSPDGFAATDAYLQDLILFEQTELIVYELYFDLSIGEKSLYYTVETNWDELKEQIPALGNNTTVWRYLWYIDVNGNEQYDSDGPDYEWLPDEFDVRSMQNLVIREGGTWREYTYRFIFLDGRVYTTTIIRETTADEFRTKLAPEANGYDHTPNANGYQNVWMCNGSLWETSQFGGGHIAGALENKDFYETADPYTYTIFFDKLTGADKTLSYTVESNWADLITEIPALEESTPNRTYGWYVDANGNGKFDAGEEWNPATFDVTTIQNLTVKEYWVGSYTVQVKLLDGSVQTITINGQTTRDELIDMLPAHSPSGVVGYHTIWTLDGAEWDPSSFTEGSIALEGKTLVEDIRATTYVLHFNGYGIVDNTSIYYTVESDWSALKQQIPNISAEGSIKIRYFWYVDVNGNGEQDDNEPEWNPDSFDVTSAKSLNIRGNGEWIRYQYRFHFVDGTIHYTEVTALTLKTEFIDHKAPQSHSPAANGYYHVWNYNGALWVPDDFKANNSALQEKDFYEVAIPYTYTITFDKLEGTDKTLSYTVESNWAELIPEIPALETNTTERLYGWYVDLNGNGEYDAGETWSPDTFDVSAAKSFTVKEYWIIGEYDVVFKPLVGPEVTIHVNGLTTKQEFLDMIPELSATAAGYKSAWMLNGVEWNPESFVAADGALIGQTIVEKRIPINYTITFDKLEGANEELIYNVESLWSDLVGTVPALTPNTLLRAYGWYVDANENGEFDAGEEWNPATFDVSAAKSFTVKEYCKLIDYKLTFAYLNGTTAELILNAETTKQEFLAMVPDLSAAATGYNNVWKLDGADWNPESFVEGSDAWVGKTVLETAIPINYTITFDKLEGANEELIYNVESLWSELVGTVPALTPNTLLRAYGWYVDANENGEFDAGEEWNPATFDVSAAKSFTVKEYYKLIDYKLTFAYLNGTTAELILNEETTKQEFLAMVPDLSAAATGYKNAWKLDGADWNPESFVEGSDAWVGKTVVETAIPLEYTITYVPLKNNTTGVAGTTVTETYTVLTESLTKVPALHTVTNKNDKLYTAYLWYVDANENGKYDVGEEWDPASFDASVATNLTVYEYGVAIDYTMVLKPIVTTRSETDVTIIYNANNWPEVYERITALLHVPTGDEIGSFTYDWYYVATGGSFVKQTFTATLSNANAEKLARTYTELRRVENFNRLYVFDRDGNKLAEYYYTKSGIYQRDDLGVDTLVVDFVTAPDVVYYTFSHWVYAGNKLNDPEATDIKFEFDTFLEDLGIDLSAKGTALNRRINVMAAYKAQEFTLTFKADGKEDVLVKYTVETDKNALVVPAAPDATLQLTYAWYLDANGNGSYDAGEEWDRSKLNTTNPTDLTLLVYSYPTVHTYTFAHDGNVFEYVTYTYLTTPQEFAAMVPVNTAATKAYTYAWYVDVNGNGQFDEGEEWSAVRFCENGLGDYEVKEYRIPNKYTITFVSFNGTRTEVSYTVETLKSEILAGMPTQTEQTVKYCYYWAKGTERWTVDDFLASECSDYEIVEMQEGRTYTLTFIPMKEKDGSYDAPISLDYKADMTPDALALLIPTNNATSLAWDYYWFRDLNNNGVYDEGEEWTPYTMDWENPDSYTIYQRREAHIYTMTFQPLVGEKVTIEYSVNDQKTWKNTITPQIPTLTEAIGDEVGVYEYAWYYADSEGKLTKRAATYFNSCTSNSKLRDMAQDFVETKRILETNKIVFYGKNGKPADRVVTYYFDRDKVVYHDELNREIEVEKDEQGNYLLPAAPELLGYVFTQWVYGGNKATSATATTTPFNLETFREDFGVEFGMNDKGTAAKANTVNAIAAYELTPYTLTFKQEGKPDYVINYNVESKKTDIEAQLPNIPDSDALFTYRVLDEEGRLWFFDSFDPQNNPGNYVITIEVTPVEYMVSFVRADGSRDRVFYTGLTTRAEFEEMMPKLINNAAFTSAWIMDGEVWSVERLFGSNDTVGEELIGNYTVEEVQVAHAFMLTFRDMDGALITQVIYTGHGPMFGTIPELPSSADGYNYYWWNTTEDVKWDGFDPMAAENLELTLRRDPITYVLNFQMPNGTVETRTYTVLDQSFQLPTATAPRGRELKWYYMEGENKIWWTKDDLYVGDLDLIGSFELIEYAVTFKPDKGADIIFVMTIEDRRQPSVSPKPYYKGEWYVQLGDAPADTDPKWTEYALPDGGKEVTVYLRYTAIPFHVTFLGVNGEFLAALDYAIDSEWTPRINAPESDRAGYVYEWFIKSGNKLIAWEDYELAGGSYSIQAVPQYALKDYNVSFQMPDGSVVPGTVTLESKPEPSIPGAPAGYKGVWYVQVGEAPAENDPKLADYDLTTGGDDVIAYVKYETIRYKLTFEADDKTVGTKGYTVEDEWEAPAVPRKPGYTGEWYVQNEAGRWVKWEEYSLKDGATSVDVRARYSLIRYEVTFTLPNGQSQTRVMSYSNKSQPSITATAPAGYSYAWYVQMGEEPADNDIPWTNYALERYNRTEITVYVKNVPLKYKLQFMVGDRVLGTLAYTVESEWIAPDAPARAGYASTWFVQVGDQKIAWNDYDLKKGERELTIVAEYTLIQYQVSFVGEDGEVKLMEMPFNGKTAPAVPAKPGYTGEWYVSIGDELIKWSEYELQTTDGIEVTVVAQYEIIRYQITFKDEAGEDVVLDLTVEDEKTAPAVPAKPGYTGEWYILVGDKQVKWSDFNLADAEGTEIEAELIYTAIQYQVTFKDEAGEDVVLDMTVENQTAPAVPAKPGYTGEWYVIVGDEQVKWSDFNLADAEGTEIEVVPVYTAIQYQVTFKDEAGEEKVLGSTVENKNQPEIPKKAGFIGAWYVQLGDAPAESDPKWSDYDLIAGGTEIKAYLKYTPRSFNVEYEDGSGNNGSFDYEVEDEWKSPEVPPKGGYTGEWFVVVDGNKIPWNEYVPDDDEHELSAVIQYTPIEYEITFKGEEEEDDVVLTITVEDVKTQPSVDARPGYSGGWYIQVGEDWIEWNEYALESTDGTALDAVLRYVPIEYNVTFKDGETSTTLSMTVENKTQPALPTKPGYTVAWGVQDGDNWIEWSQYALENTDGTEIEAVARYVAVEYAVTFKDDTGRETLVVMTVENKTQPAITDKLGYTGKWYVQDGENWIEWTEYALSDTEGTALEVVLRYTLNRYTATFYGENGQVIGTTTFTIEDKELQNVPEPPAKDGYTVEWEAYTIGAADLEIHAIYTPDAHGILFGIHWIWWLLIVILLILILLTLIYILVLRKRKLAAAVAAAAVEEPEEEAEVVIPVVDVDLKSAETPVVEPVETIDADTADTMMEDETAMAALETVGGAQKTGLKSIVNISEINDAFDAGETVDVDALKAKNMIPAKTARLKVLGGGHLDKPLTVVADAFSVQAIKMITLTGGKAVQKKVGK